MPSIKPEHVPEAVAETTDWILDWIDPDCILEYPEKKRDFVIAAIAEHVGKYYGQKNEKVALLIIDRALLAAKERLQRSKS